MTKGKSGRKGGRPKTNRRPPSGSRRGKASHLPDRLYYRLSEIARSAVRRCTDPNNKAWDDYGGRGIKVHKPWLEDRSLFVNYLSKLDGCDDTFFILDRIDNDGDYRPGNLRFVERRWSNINRRPFAHNLERDMLTGRFEKKGKEAEAEGKGKAGK